MARSRRRGSSTSTSTSSSPRSRCCAGPSWPGVPSWSAATGTRSARGRWSPRRRTRRARSGCARACPSAQPPAGAPTPCSSRPIARPTRRRRREVMAALRAMPDVVVEEIGWDEAFVAVRTAEPEALAASLQASVRSATGLSCAVGIGDTKLTAKTATGFAKPGGVARLTRADWIATMGAQPVTAIWGIGDRTARRLADAGVHTVEELARADHRDLAARFGPRDRPVVAHPRPRRRPRRRERRAARRPRPQPRGDVRARRHRRSTSSTPTPPAWPPKSPDRSPPRVVASRTSR